MALNNLSGYPEYLALMVQYRKNMGELYTETVSVDKETYWKNRELIKQLRYHALTENIDLYALEFDAKSVIKGEVLNKQINALEAKTSELREAISVEQARIYADLDAGRVPDHTKFNKLQKEQVDNNIALEKLRADKNAGYTNDEQRAYERYIKEAYLVKQMVDVRERYERSVTAEEKQKLADEAYQIRLQVNQLLLGHDSVEDFERRAWLMYTGEDISERNPNRTAEQIEKWEGHIALMHKATADYKAMNTDEQKSLDPIKTDAQLYEDEYGQAGRDMWRERKYETFSGADMSVFFAFPGYRPIDVGTASLISYSIYREKKQIRTIGAINTKGITKGPRTISGRMVFTIIREHIVEMIKRELPYTRALKNLIMDELPPFDILVSFGNEYGASAGLVIQGVTFVDEQKTMTVDDLYTENIYTYLARDIEVMKNMSASVQDPYDPLEWYSSNFTPMGSEVLGNFQPSELQVFKSGELLSDPAPFYGAAAGWNAELYNLMYNGEVTEVGSIEGDDADSGGGEEESGPPKPGDKDYKADEDKSIDTDKTVRAHLWPTNDIKSLSNRGIFFGGAIGEKDGKTLYKSYHNNGEKGVDSKSFEDVYDKVSKTRTILTLMNNNDTSITLTMLDDETKKPVAGNFTINMKWDLSPNSTKDPGDEPMKSIPSLGNDALDFTNFERNKLTRFSVIGFWKSEITFSDMLKAINTRIGKDRPDKEKFWLNTIDVTKLPDKLGHTKSKTVTVGETDMAFKSKFFGASGFKGNDTGSSINIGSGSMKIDLNDYLWFPSSITPDGDRKILKFRDLPHGANVCVTFTYNIDHPSNPNATDGRKRRFFLRLSRADWPSGNAMTKTVDLKKKQDRDRWKYYNEKDLKK